MTSSHTKQTPLQFTVVIKTRTVTKHRDDNMKLLYMTEDDDNTIDGLKQNNDDMNMHKTNELRRNF